MNSFEKTAGEFHRKPVTPRRSMQDSTFVSPSSKVWPKDAGNEGTGIGETGGEKSSPSTSSSGSERPSNLPKIFKSASEYNAAVAQRKHNLIRNTGDEDYIEDGLGTAVAAAKTGAAVGKEVGEKIAEGRVTDGGGKSPAERGHEGGLIGGPKRDEVLTHEEKVKIATKGGHARWGEAQSEREK
jgi:hypothetical protein